MAVYRTASAFFLSVSLLMWKWGYRPDDHHALWMIMMGALFVYSILGPAARWVRSGRSRSAV